MTINNGQPANKIDNTKTTNERETGMSLCCECACAVAHCFFGCTCKTPAKQRTTIVVGIATVQPQQ